MLAVAENRMSSPAPQPKVLLVEDSDDDAYLFRRALRQCGFTGEVVHVLDGRTAIARLEEAVSRAELTPDLVFLDLKIPHFSGFEVLEWIRRQTFAHPLDVAVLSGSEHSGDVDRALKLGASTYYVKPILLQQLKTRINDWQNQRTSTAHPEEARAPSAPMSAA